MRKISNVSPEDPQNKRKVGGSLSGTADVINRKMSRGTQVPPRPGLIFLSSFRTMNVITAKNKPSQLATCPYFRAGGVWHVKNYRTEANFDESAYGAIVPRRRGRANWMPSRSNNRNGPLGPGLFWNSVLLLSGQKFRSTNSVCGHCRGSVPVSRKILVWTASPLCVPGDFY